VIQAGQTDGGLVRRRTREAICNGGQFCLCILGSSPSLGAVPVNTRTLSRARCASILFR